MFRRIFPFIVLMVTVLLDTAVIPVLYYGAYSVPVTLAAALCLSLIYGRLRGLLYGMIGGLLIDISAGTLGVMTFFAMIAAFLADLLLNDRSDRVKALSPWLFHLRHAVMFFALYFVGEIVLLVYRYFETAIFEWSQVTAVLARCGVFALLTTPLYLLLRRMAAGKRGEVRAALRHNREVKHF